MKPTESKKVLKETYKKIRELIKEEKWLNAHRACVEVLRFNPDDLNIIRYKNKIEKNVRKINITSIKQDLKKIKEIEKEKNYEKVLIHLKGLEPYINDYPTLKKIIIEAQEKYEKQVKKEQKEYVKDELDKIKQLLIDKKFQEAIRTAEKLRIQKYNEEEVKEWIKKIRIDWINDELKRKNDLLKSTKFEESLLFLNRLKKIDNKNIQLINQINQTKKRYNSYKIEQKKDEIFIGMEKAQTLILMKKYSKAINKIDEVLEIDPINTRAKKLKKKAIKKEMYKINKELKENIKKANKEIKKTFKSNKKNFVKI